MKTRPSKPPIPPQIGSLVESLCAAIASENLSLAARRGLLGTLRRGVLPGKKPKSFSTKRTRQDERLKRASVDYKTGMRGSALFEKHVPQSKTMSRWRRRHEQTQFLKAVAKRVQREAKGNEKANKNGDKDGPVLAACRPTSRNRDIACRPTRGQVVTRLVARQERFLKFVASDLL